MINITYNLFDKIHCNDLKGVEDAIAQGADVNAKDSNGLMPLHWAAPDGYVNIVRALLSAGAKVDAKTKEGWTALHMVCFIHMKILKVSTTSEVSENEERIVVLDIVADRHIETIKMLVTAGADVNAKTNDGATPLRLAAFHGCADIIEVLLATGADINVRDDEGWTPLHEVACGGYTEIVRTLITAGADKTIKDIDGRNAYDVGYDLPRDVRALLKP